MHLITSNNLPNIFVTKKFKVQLKDNYYLTLIGRRYCIHVHHLQFKIALLAFELTTQELA